MKKAAFLVIDVQNAMFDEADPVFNGEELLVKLQKLLRSARSAGTPVFFIQHNEPAGEPLATGTKGWEIHPAIAPEAGERVIQKNTPDSFFATELKEALEAQQIEQIIIAGIQTELCVDTTCRRAVSSGYEVILVADTHSTWNANGLMAEQIIRHHNGTLRWFSTVLNADELKFQ
ncbi:cysteine hydrolase family protein [Planococcus lenghuensis]|uniref:Cysteine hydrolase n=1 Tax=Planococcus lenghuensis TaxID=2213202 RepID=A0A1Q2KYL4_9BACL|nr:cysteine hydrolase family protein [Planococcus lenghuensis]AQQ53300.1 cysteine hydrolase [Planococcus lenghuensis]